MQSALAYIFKISPLSFLTTTVNVVLDCETVASTFSLMTLKGGGVQTVVSLGLTSLGSEEPRFLNSWTRCSSPRTIVGGYGIAFPCSTLFLRFQIVSKARAQTREQWLFIPASRPNKGGSITQLRISSELAARIASLLMLQFTSNQIAHAKGSWRIYMFHFQWQRYKEGSSCELCQVF